MPFVVRAQVGAPLPLHKILPDHLQFRPFCANLRSCNLQCHTDLTENPIFVEAALRIRRFHELSLDENQFFNHESKLATLAAAAPKDSTSQLLLDIMSLWGKKMLKVKALSEIMGSCADEIGSKAMLIPSKTPNQHSAETPYTLVRMMAIHSNNKNNNDHKNIKYNNNDNDNDNHVLIVIMI